MNALFSDEISVDPRLQRLNDHLKTTSLIVERSSLPGRSLGVFLSKSTFPLSRAVYQEDALFYWAMSGYCDHCLGPIPNSRVYCCEMEFCSPACFSAKFNKHSLVCSTRSYEAEIESEASSMHEASPSFETAAELIIKRKRESCKRGIFDVLFYLFECIAQELPEAKSELRAVVTAFLKLGEICPAGLAGASGIASNINFEQNDAMANGNSELTPGSLVDAGIDGQSLENILVSGANNYHLILSKQDIVQVMRVFSNVRAVLQLLEPDFNYTGSYGIVKKMLLNEKMLNWLWSVVSAAKIPIVHKETVVGYGVYNIASVVNNGQQATAKFVFTNSRLSIYSAIEEGELFVEDNCRLEDSVEQALFQE